MSYSPPSATAAYFSFQGQAAYTPPAAAEVDFSWEPVIIEIEMAIQGVPILGSPGAVMEQAYSAILVGAEATGYPEALANQKAAMVLQAQPGAGSPAAVAAQQVVLLQPSAGLGDSLTLGHFGYLAQATASAAESLPEATARQRYRAIATAAGAIGTPRVTAFALPAVAADIPQAITYYFAKLTGSADGLTDVTLPMASFSVRHRYDGPSYYQLAIPTYAYVSAIAARPNGEIVIWSKTGDIEEELLRGDLGNVRTDRGPKSQSISISGNSERDATNPVTYLLAEALYASTTFEGESRLRIPPRAAIRPGDFIRYADLNFQAGEIAWSVAVSAGGMAITMEIASLPVDA